RHQRLVAGADQLREPAAEDRLLPEEIGLGLLLDARLEHGRAGAADGLGVREPDLPRVAHRVLVDREQAGHATALLVLAAHEMSGALRRDHEDVHVGGRDDLLVVDVEAVAEGEVVDLGQPWGDVGLESVAARPVRHQDHHDVGFLRRRRRVDDAQPLALRLRAGGAVAAEPHAHVAAAVAQVERMGVPLASVADDGDLLALERLEARVLVVIDVHAARSLSFPSPVRGRASRNRATFPVRTISFMPIGLSSSRSAPILSSVPVTSITYDFRDTSTILPRKMSTMLATSPRVFSSTATRSSTSSRSTCSPSAKSVTLMTQMSLFNCFSICSRMRSSPR